MFLYSDGSQADTIIKLGAAHPGDEVVLPPGNFTWGAGGSYITLDKAVRLRGQGPGVTIISIHTGAQQWSNGGVVSMAAAGAILSDLSMNQAGDVRTTAVRASNYNDWRITNVTYNSQANVGYFIYSDTYGLIDHCIINCVAGDDEPMVFRGPTDAWQTPDSMGSLNAVYIENCVWNNLGYPDFNANAKGVIRFCTFNGNIKLDGHGTNTNTPPRSFRHVEFYNNDWPSWVQVCVELRGGTGRIFNNTSVAGGLTIGDYGVVDHGKTGADWPLPDQIGVGMDPTVAGSSPLYAWGNRQLGARWPISNAIWGVPMTGVVEPNRDYFDEVSGTFTGAGGVGIGTKAQMLAITPTLAKVGYWVTDEGTWNTENGTTGKPGFGKGHGKFYKWSGSAWVFNYEPASYPHPLTVPVVYPDRMARVSTTRFKVRR